MNTPLPKEPAEPTSPNTASDPGSEDCANCGAELTNTYCGVCGQRAANRVVPLWQVTNEFLEDLFDLDLRILRTFPIFVLQPGQLTVEYVHGRRRQYIRPLRLYLFSSFLLFTVLAFTNLNGFSFSFAPATEEVKADVQAARAKLDALRAELAHQIDPAPNRQEPVAVPKSNAPLSPDSASTVARRQIAASVDEGMKKLDEALATMGPTLTAQYAESPPPHRPSPARWTSRSTPGSPYRPSSCRFSTILATFSAT